MLIRIALIILLSQSLLIYSADVPRAYPFSPAPISSSPVTGLYSWSVQPVDGTAELVILSCHRCAAAQDSSSNVPLLSVLRDTLGGASSETSRLTYLWLLSAGYYNLGQRILSAVPFFYWPVGNSAPSSGPGFPRPLLNLNTPLHPVMAQAGRSIVQWTAFDPLANPVRAMSRSYQANQTDNDRLHLQQAIDLLQNAPAVLNRPGLTEEEINILIARLELRKSLVGGLLASQHTAEFGAQTRFENQRVRSRNFEAIRQFAEKTGTYSESLNLAGSTDQFAILWFPFNSAKPDTGIPSKPIWKLLNIRDPWSDRSLVEGRGLTFQRAFDADGRLLPEGVSGARTATLVPLAVYSLSYPQMPLLLVDFHNRSSVRRHELLQRAVTELTSGVIGISVFANWYYYAGAFAYETLWARRGTAANQADRLDCYAEFRTELTLDQRGNPLLRGELLSRIGSLSVNPLDSDSTRNIANARVRFARLQRAANGKELPAQLDRERRAELAAFGESTGSTVRREALHFLSFGIYTKRVSEDERNLTRLERDRRISYQLNWLDAAVANNTDPHIALSGAQIDESVRELRALLGDVKSEPVLQHAKATLARLQTLSTGGEETAKLIQVIGANRVR